MRSLQRLFVQKVSSRYSTIETLVPTTVQGSLTGLASADLPSVDINPLKTVAKLFRDSGIDGLSRGLRWVELLQRGGYVLVCQ